MTSATRTTIDTVTVSQLLALRAEAGAAGDEAQYQLATEALEAVRGCADALSLRALHACVAALNAAGE